MLGDLLRLSRTLAALVSLDDGVAPNACASRFSGNVSSKTACLRIHEEAHNFQVLCGLGATFAD